MQRKQTEWSDPTAQTVIKIDDIKSDIRRYTHLAALLEAAGKKGLARQYMLLADEYMRLIPPDFYGVKR